MQLFMQNLCRCCQKSVYLPCRYPNTGLQAPACGRRLYMKKAFTKRLVLTFRNFATFRYSQEQGNSRCPTWYVFTPYHTFTPFRREAYWCKHIRRGVSALLVLLYRAMRRPRSVDGRTVRTPTLYLYIIIKVIYLSFGEIKDCKVK